MEDMAKSLIRGLVGLLSPEDRIPGGPAHPQQQAAAVDKAVDRDRQVQCSQSVSPQPPGDEKGIGQDIAG